ncbi:MAG: lipase family protein [Myxococcales bacterium]|nr:lipase family protein [Myxococcales bacterium]
MTTTFAFNTLLQPASTTIQSAPSGFDPQVAFFLASATAAVVQLFAQGSTTLSPAMLAALPLAGGAASYQQLATLSTSEELGLGSSPATTTQPSSTPGEFMQTTIGVALQALDSSQNPLFTVIALRGTQTYSEWVNDLTAIPQGFALAFNVGSVHSGFYTVYTTGPNGLAASPGQARPPGSLAAQILSLVTASSWPSKVPLFVTGHSLGAALAELCAMDLVSNAQSHFSSLTMINFAPPRVSAGFLDQGSTLPADLYDPTKFMTNFQAKVPSSYSVVNAADLVPVLPPTLGKASAIQIEFFPAVAASNVIMYCAQLGTIGNNHELTLNYLPYMAALAAGFST